MTYVSNPSVVVEVSLQTGAVVKGSMKLQLLSTRRQDGRFSYAHCSRGRGARRFVSRAIVYIPAQH
jgi:hypothetical protein